MRIAVIFLLTMQEGIQYTDISGFGINDFLQFSEACLQVLDIKITFFYGKMAEIAFHFNLFRLEKSMM